jgi:epoxide hydrolase-like predicted phosphatase
MKITAVLWDMGGVFLRTFDRSGRARWAKRLGLSEGELEKAVFEGKAARRAALGQATEDEIWRSAGEQLGLAEADREAFSRDFFAGDQLDHELLEFIRRLRPRWKTGLITNAWPGIRTWLVERWGAADAFDEMVISAEEGVAKPDPRIYHLTLDRLGVDPPHAVFVDDFEENVAGAQAIGMQGIRFVSTAQAMADVRSLLGLED